MSNYHIKTFEEYFHIYVNLFVNPENFWEEVARSILFGSKRWDNVLRGILVSLKSHGFEGAQLNI